jgi:hypothetical protein
MKTNLILRLQLSRLVDIGYAGLAASVVMALSIHQAHGQLGIKLTPDRSSAVLTWVGAGFQLEQAADVLGPYSPVQGASSPYVWAVSGSASFFRLRLAGGGVHGSLFAQFGTNTAPVQIFLPGIQVYLHNTDTAADSAPVVSDLFGRYAFPTQPPGTYELRWNAQLGWAAGNHPDPIVVGDDTQYPIPAQIVAAQNGGVIYGRVTLSNGDSPWFYDELFAENHTTSVTVLDAGRTVILAGPVNADVGGWYAVAGLPSGVDMAARATAEAATTTLSVPAAAVSFDGAAVAATDLQLPNQKPEILAVTPQISGVTVQTAPGGSAIQLNAETRDLDGDPLTYAWKALPGAGSLAPTSGSSVQWTLPTGAGNHSVYLEAKDGRGGYARHRVDFFVNQTNTIFSGLVVDHDTGFPVQGASVFVNGTNTATTAANGFFRVSAALAKRYVFNITKTGYALFSRVVYDSGETGQTWQLVPAQTQVVDPTQPIVLVDTRPGQTNGVIVRVPADGLVDSDGNPPLGPLTAYLVTYDIAGGQAPGDWGALTGGQESSLISFGAGFVEFVDAALTKYNLAPGITAEVDIVPPAAMLAGAPATTPMWSYDETDGYWKQSGTATLNTATGTYVGTVDHFSAFNTDLTFVDAACLKVLLYPPLPTGVRLQMRDPSGVKFGQTFNFVLDRPLRGLYRVPANYDVELRLFSSDGKEYAEGNPDGKLVIERVPGTPLPGNIVNTGPAIPAGQTLWPDEPYDTCNLVILRLAVEANPSVFLTRKLPGTDAQAKAYYEAVDPLGKRTTLGDWWTNNGFTVDQVTGWPTDKSMPGGDPKVVRTSYLNNNDLGSGRDMYFRDRGGGKIAAFVSNYGQFNQDPANADLAAARATPGATVCMEYSPVENQDPNISVVKFFVFKDGDGKASAVLQRGADLDGFGVKFVPNLCLNCHGGDYYPSSPTAPTFADINMHAHFRELDTATYKFPDMRLAPNLVEQTNFQAQNLLVTNGACASQGIRDLILGWYTSGSTSQDNIWTPSGWMGSGSTLYHQMVKQSCRTCHVAFTDDTSPGGLNWTTYAQLTTRQPGLKTFVLCTRYRYMPHSVITYRNFWLSSPNQPAVLRTYSDGSVWTPIGADCPP